MRNPVLQLWGLAKRHWGPSILAPWLFLTFTLCAHGELWPATVALGLGTFSYYGMAKIEAFEKARQE